MSAALALVQSAPLASFTKPERPALRYHGGKFLLAPWIMEHMPAHRVYIEPFGGAMSVLLQKPQSHTEIYNDLDSRIVEYFQVLRDPVSASRLRQLLQLTPFHEAELQLSCEWSDDPIERARRLVVRSFMSHGSDGVTSDGIPGFRSTASKSGTSPARDWDNLPAHLEAITHRLRNVSFLKRPALELLSKYNAPDTLIYADPPYVPDTRSEKRQKAKRVMSYRHDMSVAQHRELLKALKASRSMIVLSGYACDLYDKALKGWTRYNCRAQTAGKARKVESIWLNPLAESRRPNPSLFGAI